MSVCRNCGFDELVVIRHTPETGEVEGDDGTTHLYCPNCDNGLCPECA